ncbi:hypothetical protein FA95DRAFT_1586455 [Auriscalpium vulgare]|uniref:Uncharacterized protein n=1 Tax=Auriscalpium vulgare TaxID=40419 RepID=A0ACB8SAG8_9AGAM|nr:hypothetical protein FA95DRAFT_1586455 [Auriscalpium vulgare]
MSALPVPPPQHPSRRSTSHSSPEASPSKSPAVTPASTPQSPAATFATTPATLQLPLRTPASSPAVSFQSPSPAVSNAPLRSPPAPSTESSLPSPLLSAPPPRASGHIVSSQPELSPPPKRLDDPDEGLTEAQLRQLYEDEEIERFFHLFKAHVSEVKLPGAQSAKDPIVSEPTPFDSIVHDDIEGNDDDDPPAVLGPGSFGRSHNAASKISLSRQSNSLAEYIALEFLVPHLPPAQSPSPSFTLGRFKLAIQRLFIVFDEGYLPFLIHLKRLACWEDQNKSLRRCGVFWILWLFDLLLPAFFLYLVYLLLSRRLLPYPTLRELREHRQKVRHAQEFGNQLQARLLAPSSFGAGDIWKLTKLLPKLVKSSPKNSAGKDGKETTTLADGDVYADPDVLFPLEETKEERDLKRVGLRLLTELVDFHERLKSIFHWREPWSSNAATLLFLILFAVTMTVPAKYIAKFMYFSVGFIFWHIIPVVAALPSSELSRIPIPLHQVPTDTDVAMELISQRVAQGRPVLPRKRARSVGEDGDLKESARPESGWRGSGSDENTSVDWKKFGGMVSSSKTWASGKKAIPETHSGPGRRVETNTFPSNHTSGPGLITLTTKALYFTALASTSPKITIPVESVTGIKKSGLLKGLTISWCAKSDEGNEDRTEVFRWIGGRDEVFARLLGSNGRKWVKT